jgi:hypothetical protein
MNRSILFTPFLATVILAAACLLPQAAEGKDKHRSKGRSEIAPPRDSRHDDDGARRSYRSHPSSGFVLSFGTGYAGRGYYYGPPRSPYYYERPEVRYYATREAARREYYSRGDNNSSGASVQQALRRRGYYHGPVDGQIGPQSRRAIARYQQERGLRVTGGISPSLLHSLGL